MTTNTATSAHIFAPGARVVIRDEEWIVRAVKSSSFGGSAVHVVGVSELVRGRERIFLSALDEIRELRPEDTRLVVDTSPRHRLARLYLESLLRRTPPTGPALTIGHRAAIRPTQYQLQPAARALRLPRARILMADGVGLGKTIEVGILLSELIRRGSGERILVVALKSILAQFQRELWSRFAIPLVRLDSVGIRRVQSRIPSNMNPFHFYDRAIISMDTLKKDAKYRRYLEEARWDVIVIDECQNVAVRARPGSSQMSDRARLAQLLAHTTDSLILTSATPHDGRAESFASLINLLEPTAVADPQNYTREEVEDFFLRRFKKDIRYEVQEAFPERVARLQRETAGTSEDAVLESLRQVTFRTINRVRLSGDSGRSRSARTGRRASNAPGGPDGDHGVLFRVLLLKSFLSSSAALIETIDHRLSKLGEDSAGDERDIVADRRTLENVRALAAKITPATFTKYQSLLGWLRRHGFDQRGNRERVVLFSERIATLRFLEEHLRRDLRLADDALEIFHGSLDDQKQMELVQSFSVADSKLRILLASDVASEGINLHFQCHHLIHFDLPWSLITLEQRNGRIDRFGQTQKPEITYLLTIPEDERIKGDLRILERLIEKEEQAHKTLGDVAWLMNLHTAEREEEAIAESIEKGEAPEQTLPDTPVHSDLMDILFGGTVSSEPAPEVSNPVRLFPDDLAYAREALPVALGEDAQDLVDWHDHLAGFTLRPPEDLQRRFEYLPRELTEDGATFRLTVDRPRVMAALEAAREHSEGWPEWQLFWELHPIAQWLDDRVLAQFERHEAPILRLARGVDPGEQVYLFQGLISNHRSQPVLTDWFGVSFATNGSHRIRHIEELLEATKLSEAPANPGRDLPDNLRASLDARREEAVRLAREHMIHHRNERAATLGQPLAQATQRLATWRERLNRSREQYRARLLAGSGTISRTAMQRLERERNEADRIQEEFRRWIDEGVRTVDDPYLRLAAVILRQES
jgi:superfamily II DNA or RNA helicase